jgi:hypothetical protein
VGWPGQAFLLILNAFAHAANIAAQIDKYRQTLPANIAAQIDNDCRSPMTQWTV